MYSLGFVIVSLLLEIFVRYARYSQYLKWLSLSLVVYVATAFLTPVPWKEVAKATFVPHVRWSASFLAMLIAVLGTTISPYLFFWQSSMETEEIKASAQKKELKKKPQQAKEEFLRIRLDTDLGMGISNVIAFFIILTMAVTVGSASGKHEINTAAEAADALGKALGTTHQGWVARLFFALGIIGTGLLAMPVLAGSAAYAVCEAAKWRTGLDEKWSQARGFYGTLVIATLLALGMNLTPGVSPMRALVWAAVINGVVAVPVMAIMVKMAGDRRVVGQFAVEGRLLRIVGWIATGVMGLATIGMFATLGK